MSREESPSRDVAYFSALYDADPDPWNFAGSDYEAQKYHATIAALEDRRFDSGFEIGCSIGVLTCMLASRCTNLLAVDIVESALADARTRCADLSNIAFASRRIPEQWPGGQNFDLILCSEMLYFLNPTDIARTARLATASLSPGGIVLLVNYTAPIAEPCSGDEAAEIFITASCDALIPTRQERQETFRIDRLEEKSTSFLWAKKKAPLRAQKEF